MHNGIYTVRTEPHREMPLVSAHVNRYILRNFTTRVNTPAIPHFLEESHEVEFHPRSEYHQGPGGVVLRCTRPGRVEVPWLQGPKIFNLEVRTHDPMAIDPYPYGQFPYWGLGEPQVQVYPAGPFGHYAPQDTGYINLRTGYGYPGDVFTRYQRKVLLGIRHHDGLTALRWRQLSTIIPEYIYNRVVNGEEIFQPPKRFALLGGAGPGLDDDRGPPFIRMFKSGPQMAANPGGHRLHPPTPITRREPLMATGWVGISFNGDADAGQWSVAWHMVGG